MYKKIHYFETYSSFLFCYPRYSIVTQIIWATLVWGKMKLFQQMLVAGASLSLLAPVAAQASDVVNIEEMNSYARSQSKSSRIDSKTFINEVSEDIAILKGRVDGLEAQQNNFEAGAFSETTTMDGKAIFTLGAMDYSLASETKSEAAKAFYTYTMIMV